MSDSGPDHHAQAQHIAELLTPEEFGQYLLHSRSEILFVLRALHSSKALVTLHFDNGKALLPSAILAASDSGLVLDSSADAELNRRALTARDLTCAAMQEKIRIQFPLQGLREVIEGGRAAFAADLPSNLLRLQRREFYRLTMPMAQPIKCRIPVSEGEHHHVEANLIDISGGGLAVMAPPEGLHFEAGMEFPNCRVELPGVGTVVTELQVRSIFEMTLRNGSVVKRAGCQFVDLPGPMLTLIQRYIIRVERERKARESGLG